MSALTLDKLMTVKKEIDALAPRIIGTDYLPPGIPAVQFGGIMIVANDLIPEDLIVVRSGLHTTFFEVGSR